jgi:RES domain-containing protein
VDPLSGKGGSVVAGRWHFQGTRIVYTSATLSLAALELLVHVDVDHAPSDLMAIGIDIPDRIEVAAVSVGDLPVGWREVPGPRSLQERGAAWLASGRTAVLRVPSTVVPHESNLLINPNQPEVKKLRVVRIEAFRLDPRLLR